MPPRTARTRPRPTPARHSLTTQLREAIESQGWTAYALGHRSGVDPGVIARFLNQDRDIRMETADRLAAVLGLKLVEVAGRRRPPKKAARPAAEVQEWTGGAEGGRLK